MNLKKEWLRPQPILLFLGLLLTALIHRQSLLPLFANNLLLLKAELWLLIVLLAANAISLTLLVAFKITSVIKNYKEKHKYLKKRFGLVWRYTKQGDQFGSVPYCPKHKPIRKLDYGNKNIPNSTLIQPIWVCSECNHKEIAPKEKGRTYPMLEAINLMNLYFEGRGLGS